MKEKSIGKGNQYRKGKGQYTPGIGNFTPYGTTGYTTPGFSKGNGKGYPTTPFYANCTNCGIYGHSKGRCPELGKAFKRNCKGCGKRGHVEAVCPVKIPKIKERGN